jgi:hypothetical protein
MERKYRYFRTHFGDFLGKMPLLEVRLRNGDDYIDVDCLVDSGARDSMFHTDFADELGIDLTGREQYDYYAVDGNIMRGWVAPVQLEINGIDQPIQINVAFVEDNEIPILGQSGFFDSFEVRFRGYNGVFEIIPVLHPTGDEYLM